MKTLQTLLADLIVFDYKVRAWHWSVQDAWGYQVHKQTDKLHDLVSGFIDAVAEKIKMRHEMPVASLAEAVRLASLKELPSANFGSVEVVKAVIQDLTALEQVTLAIKADHMLQPLFDEIFLFIDEQRYLFGLNLKP